MKTIKDLQISTPEAEGISSQAIFNFIKDIEDNNIELHSFILARNNKVISSGWWKPFTPETPHILWSLSKIFTSTAVGMALGEGLFSVNDKVISFFPEDTPKEVSPYLAEMSVYHLLSMTTGFDSEPFPENIHDSWIKSFLNTPLTYKPGTEFVYCSLATYMLSAIIQKTSGITLFEYLNHRLFKPLDITEATWDLSPEGVNTGGWGLKATTESITKLGLLYLNKGIWNGQRIISEAWVTEATSKQVSTGKDSRDDWGLGYGFQFWQCQHNNFRGDGAGGQFCIVMPKHNAVMTITSSVADMQAVLHLFWENILPGFTNTSLKTSDNVSNVLNNKMKNLAIPFPKHLEGSPIQNNFSGKRYNFPRNILEIKSILFDFTKEKSLKIALENRERIDLKFGYNQWIKSNCRFLIVNAIDKAFENIQSAGAWKNDNTFELKVISTQQASETLQFIFENNEVTLIITSPFTEKTSFKGYLE